MTKTRKTNGNNLKVKARGGAKTLTNKKALNRTYGTRSNTQVNRRKSTDTSIAENKRKRSIKFLNKLAKVKKDNELNEGPKTRSWKTTLVQESRIKEKVAQSSNKNKSTEGAKLVKLPKRVSDKRKTRSSTRGRPPKEPLKALPLKASKRGRKRKVANFELPKAKRVKVSNEADSSCELKSISLRSGKKTSTVSTPSKNVKKVKQAIPRSANKKKCAPKTPKKDNSTELSSVANKAKDDLHKSEEEVSDEAPSSPSLEESNSSIDDPVDSVSSDERSSWSSPEEEPNKDEVQPTTPKGSNQSVVRDPMEIDEEVGPNIQNHDDCSLIENQESPQIDQEVGGNDEQSVQDSKNLESERIENQFEDLSSDENQVEVKPQTIEVQPPAEDTCKSKPQS